MTITVNNKEKIVPPTSVVSSLLEQLQVVPNGIAIAVNNSIISKPNWDTTRLTENDTVTIIQATQGG